MSIKLDEQVVRETLEYILEDLLQGANLKFNDLKGLVKEIARNTVEISVLAAQTGAPDSKLYRELYGQTLLLLEISRVRVSKAIKERIQVAIQTAAQILIAAITQI